MRDRFDTFLSRVVKKPFELSGESVPAWPEARTKDGHGSSLRIPFFELNVVVVGYANEVIIGGWLINNLWVFGLGTGPPSAGTSLESDYIAHRDTTFNKQLITDEREDIQPKRLLNQAVFMRSSVVDS